MALGLPLFVVCSSGALAVLGHDWDWIADSARRAQGPAVTNWAAVGSSLDQITGVAWANVMAPVQDGHAGVAIGQSARGQLQYAFFEPSTGEILARRNVLSIQVYLRQFHKTFVIPFGLYAVCLLGVGLLVSAVTGLVSYRRFWRHAFRLRLGRGLRVLVADLHRNLGTWSFVLAIILAVTGVWYLVEALGHDLADARVEPEPPTLSEARLAALGPATPALPIGDLVAAAERAMPDLDVRMVRLPADPKDAVRIDGQTDAWLVRDRASRVYLDPYSGVVLGSQRAEQLNPLQRWSDTADPLHFGTFGGLVTKWLWFLFGIVLSVAVLAGPALAELRRASRQRAPTVRARLARPTVLIAGAVAVIALAAAVFASARGYGSRIVSGLPPATAVAGPVELGPWELAVTEHRAEGASRGTVLLTPLGDGPPSVPRWKDVSVVGPEGPLAGQGTRWAAGDMEGLTLRITRWDGGEQEAPLTFSSATTPRARQVLSAAHLDEPPLEPPPYVLVFIVALLLFELAGVLFWGWLVVRVAGPGASVSRGAPATPSKPMSFPRPSSPGAS